MFQLPCTLWAVRMSETNRLASIHGQANRLLRCHVIAGRKTRRTLIDYQLSKKVSSNFDPFLKPYFALSRLLSTTYLNL